MRQLNMNGSEVLELSMEMENIKMYIQTTEINNIIPQWERSQKAIVVEEKTMIIGKWQNKKAETGRLKIYYIKIS